MSHNDMQIIVDTTNIQPATLVHNLGMYFDDELSMRQHVARIGQTVLYNLRHLRSVRQSLDKDVTAQLVSVCILWHFDNSNVVLTGAATLRRLTK
jgi:hypothetical protein